MEYKPYRAVGDKTPVQNVTVTYTGFKRSDEKKDWTKISAYL